MTDAELAKWLREWGAGLSVELRHVSPEGKALTALVALLRETANCHPDDIFALQDRLDAVLGHDDLAEAINKSQIEQGQEDRQF